MNNTLEDIKTVLAAKEIVESHRRAQTQEDNQSIVSNLTQTEKQLDWVVDRLKLKHFDETHGVCEEGV
jgi:hypothetical protein